MTQDARGRRAPRRARIAAAIAGSTLLCLAAPALAAAPTVTTLAPDTTVISDTYALLSGIVNPQGLPTVYLFQWGRTTAYGHNTPVTSAGNGKADVPVDVSLYDSDGLKPATTYHYRLVAEVQATGAYAIDNGSFSGQDQTFTTSPALAVAFVGRSAKVVHGRVPVKLKLVGPPGENATGQLTLRFALGKHRYSVPSASYGLNVGQSKTIDVRLTKAAEAALAAASHGRLKVLASVKTAGIKKPVTEQLTVKR